MDLLDIQTAHQEWVQVGGGGVGGLFLDVYTWISCKECYLVWWLVSPVCYRVFVVLIGSCRLVGFAVALLITSTTYAEFLVSSSLSVCMQDSSFLSMFQKLHRGPKPKSGSVSDHIAGQSCVQILHSPFLHAWTAKHIHTVAWLKAWSSLYPDWCSLYSYTLSCMSVTNQDVTVMCVSWQGINVTAVHLPPDSGSLSWK